MNIKNHIKGMAKQATASATLEIECPLIVRSDDVIERANYLSKL